MYVAPIQNIDLSDLNLIAKMTNFVVLLSIFFRFVSIPSDISLCKREQTPKANACMRMNMRYVLKKKKELMCRYCGLKVY